MGYILQAVGATILLCMLCTCCGIAFLAGHPVASSTSSMPNAAASSAGGFNPGLLGSRLLLLTTVAGGFALMGLGVGQQADRGRSPAVGSAVASLLMCAGYLAAAILLITAPAGSVLLILKVLAVVGCVLAGALSILTLAAASQVLHDPPISADAPTVPADAFPDPWAEKREKIDSIVGQDIDRRRRKLMRELKELDRLEEEMKEDGSEGGN